MAFFSPFKTSTRATKNVRDMTGMHDAKARAGTYKPWAWRRGTAAGTESVRRTAMDTETPLAGRQPWGCPSSDRRWPNASAAAVPPVLLAAVAVAAVETVAERTAARQ